MIMKSAVMAAVASMSMASQRRSMPFPKIQQIRKPTENIKVYPITKTRFKASFKDAFGMTHSVTGTYKSEDAARMAAWVAMKSRF